MTARYDKASPDACTLLEQFDEFHLAEMLVTAQATLARVRALAEEYPAGIDTALIHAALDVPEPAGADITPAEPATVTDPAWLCQQYAKAIAADDGHPWDTLPADRQEDYLDNADAVMRVRDRHVAQLRQRLELADQLARENTELHRYHAEDRDALTEMRAAITRLRGEREQQRQRADRLAAELSALQGVADADSKQLAEVDQRCDRYAATLTRIRSTIHIADAEDATDWQRGYRACANRVTAELDSNEEPGAHVYLSTGCRHGDHAYCKNMTGLNGRKRPGECKHCGAKCICGCHPTEEQS